MIFTRGNEVCDVRQFTPLFILAWLFEYVKDRCLNTSSSGVRDGALVYEENTKE